MNTAIDAPGPGPSVRQLDDTATLESRRQTTGDQPTTPAPGLVVIFCNGHPARRLIHVGRGTIDLGRRELAADDVLDPGISRDHLRVAFDGTDWEVADLESHNGTFVAGVRIDKAARVPSRSVVRVGGTLLLTLEDVTPFERFGVGVRDAVVAGPSLRRALDSIAVMSRSGKVSSLLVTGETGTGKEIAASTFHAHGRDPSGPFVAVNCATIPKEIAERLLFGSRRGAFSGALDTEGFVQAAHGGTLFLDEIAELSADVQGKLLRMLETRTVTRLGATRPEPVDIRVCAATWRALREELATGGFRQDLYFRIAQAQVRLPPLRERVEEIPWHVQEVLRENGDHAALGATSRFVEACALRHWPGNVRELRAEVRRAAVAAGATESRGLGADDLDPAAGVALKQAKAGPSALRFPDDEVANALAAEKGNVASAARRLGVHRNKVRRWLERHQVEASSFKDPKADPP